MAIDLESIGLTIEELQERVVDRMCERLLRESCLDEDGDEITRATLFQRSVVDLVKAQVDKSIGTIAEKHLLPNVAKYIEDLSLQETNRWGEKQGGPVTFVEYLVSRAENYMIEKVDFKGQSKTESGGYSWDGRTTRLVHLIHEHLKYSIESAMKSALGLANKTVTDSLREAVNEALKRVQVTVKTEVTEKR